MKLSIDSLRRSVEGRGYRFFDSGNYNLNLIGIRAADRSANTFNDRLAVVFKQSGQWQFFQFDCSTDPGTYYRQNPINEKGTAVLVPGQYPGAFTIGRHQGKYPALTQARVLPVYRDADRDAEIDTDVEIDTGWHGINLHRANPTLTSVQVDRWSAGCQVIADPHEFEILMSLCRASAARWGARFTYTLINEEDLV